MQPRDFLVSEENPAWDLIGLDPERRMGLLLDSRLVDQLRQKPLDGTSDLDAAFGLATLAHDELVAFGTSGDQNLEDQDIALVLRSLRAVLRRLGTTLDLPFRDFKGFHGYWSANDMSGPGGWGARRGYLQGAFEPIFRQLGELEDRQADGAICGVDGELKNIIFASKGPKPEIVLRDAINNLVEITKNAEHCLFYDRPLSDTGLSLADLTDWWRAINHLSASLDTGLPKSSDFKPERMIFRAYCERYGGEAGHQQPPLLPQVYLHYDPRTRRERLGQPGVLLRERMDFLLLLPHDVRIVIELDGQQHYAEGEIASPRLYAEMVAEDRKLRLKGYEVYRFGGYELKRSGAEAMLRQFFDDLLSRHR
ncbi:hypothetical protein ACIBG7_27115 [Nonomuraea sp. NPDC050328]|uniref:hypothetical protein n=1 Tax=Nonomuraea sp. NPDC050328 TaxID=3364361 RepID=UPI003790A5EF